MILQIVRYIVALPVFGVVATAAFAESEIPGKHLWPKYRLLGHSVAAGISHINGLDQTLALYPIHTHLILIVFLIFHFECTCLDAVIYTLLWLTCAARYLPGFPSGNLYSIQ